MCEIMEQEYNKGIQEGVKQGIKQGVKQGVRQGAEQEKEKNIRNTVSVLREEGKTAPEIAKIIAAIFGLSEKAAAAKATQQSVSPCLKAGA